MGRNANTSAGRVRALRRKLIKHADLAIAVLVTVLALVIFRFAVISQEGSSLSFLQKVELSSLDARFLFRGTRPHDERIVIVGIDEKTLQRFGAYPIPRENYAKLLDKLTLAGARIVAFDVAFPTASKQGASRTKTIAGGSECAADTQDPDAAFAKSLADSKMAILGHVFLNEKRAPDIDQKASEDYYNTIWGEALPQMRADKAAGKFDLGKTWTDNGGMVALGIEANLPRFRDAARSYGFLNSDPDADGTTRRALLIIRYRDKDFFASLPIQVIRLFEGIPDQAVAGIMNRQGLTSIELGRHVIKTQANGTTLINYAGPYRTYAHYSLADVVEGVVPLESFRDKIVLVGADGLGMGDLRKTPFREEDYMGVEIHANIIDNLLNGEMPGRGFLRRGLREEFVDLALIVFFGLVLGLWFGRVRPLYAGISAAMILVIFAGLAYWMFARWGIWISFVLPASTLAWNYVAITTYRMAVEEKEKRQIRAKFSLYVSPVVIDLIEKDPERYLKSGGELKTLTVFFSDIRGFTSLSEKLSPEELVELLNHYLGEMTEIVFRHGGTVDKYIGDAVMAFWNSPVPQPDHAVLACSCAVDMCRRLEELNIAWEQRGQSRLNIGIGLNTGPAKVGNMGSEVRFAWTAIGDNVNLASRLESLTKQYRAGVIISESTRNEIGERFVCRELDLIRVTGKQQPVTIFELLGYADESAKYSDLLRKYKDALEAYRSQQWREAMLQFQSVLTAYPDDGPSRVLFSRCAEFVQEAPAPDWDGVYVMKQK